MKSCISTTSETGPDKEAEAEAEADFFTENREQCRSQQNLSFVDTVFEGH